MVLVDFRRTWTFGLCSLFILHNMVSATSLNQNKRKGPYFVSDGIDFQKQYRLEDFFWTGSGDGPVTEEQFFNNTETEISVVEASPFDSWRTTTVFHTTTILFATVYPPADGCINEGCKPEISIIQTESVDFSLSKILPPEVPDILPTPSQVIPKTDSISVPDEFFKAKESGAVTNTFEPPQSPKVFSTKQTTSPKAEANQNAYTKPELNTQDVAITTVFPELFPVDEKYWLMTVLRNDKYSPKFNVNSTEQKLSSLYRKAFYRRQDNFDFRRDRKILEPIKVKIINVTNEGNNIEMIYFVSAGGKPVPAMSAANDMKLLTANEVIAELGYPILTKAEPHIKGIVPLGARVKGRTRDTWLLIGSVIAAILLLIILAAFFALGLSKKRTQRSASKGISNKKQVFQEEEGSSNLAFEEETESKAKSSRQKQFQTEDTKTVGETSGVFVKFNENERRGSTTSSCCSGSSEASLVRLRHQQKRKERKREEMDDKPKPKPRTRIRRIESSDCSKNYKRREYRQSAGSAISKNTFEEITTEGYDDMDCSPRVAKSPTSYLSMPSVKAFPRGAKIPDSLNKVLEPTSIRHLDADSDSQNEYPRCYRDKHHDIQVEQICEVTNKFVKKKNLTRHASLEGEDPGFIGPVVWNRHCQRVNEGGSGVVLEECDENVNVGRMRKRFNELLDDALSLFGSRNGSPDGSDVVPVRQPDNRVHSAVVRPAALLPDETGTCRPKTTGSKRPQSSVICGPRGAWETPSCSTLTRPLSAGVCGTSSPTIDRNFIYVNSDLAPNDPAIPLIAAIKDELKKLEDPSRRES